MLKKYDFLKKLGEYRAYAPLILRVVLGIIFAAHGYQKLTGMDGVFGMVTGLGLPAFSAYILTYTELLGGLALIAGLATRYAAALIAIVMIVAIWKVKLATGLLGGYELELGFLATAVALMLTGAGPWSLDKVLCGED